MCKRIISLLLAFMMCIPLGVTVFAAIKPTSKSSRFTTISTGGWMGSGFAIKSDNSLWAWGGNFSGTIGDGSSINKHQLKPKKIMDNAVSVFASDNNSAAIKTDGTLWVWGNNMNGQVNSSANGVESKPMKKLDNVAAAALGSNHVLAIKNDGTLWSWGWNSNGQLGNGKRDTAAMVKNTTPVKIMDNVTTVAAGMMSSYAIRSDGTLWAWGGNYNGQLGDGTKKDRLKPVRIMGDARFVATSGDATYAIKNDGTLWAWGVGAIGDGAGTARSKPIKIMDNVSSVAPGHATYAIKTDGSLWYWGTNIYGTFANGENDGRELMPVKSDIKDVVAVANSNSNTFFLKKDATLLGVGANENGQLGYGDKHNDMTVPDSTFGWTHPIQTVPVKIMNNVKMP